MNDTEVLEKRRSLGAKLERLDAEADQIEAAHAALAERAKAHEVKREALAKEVADFSDALAPYPKQVYVRGPRK